MFEIGLSRLSCCGLESCKVMDRELSHSDAKRMVQILLVEKKTDLQSEAFQELIQAAGTEKNRGMLLINGTLKIIRHSYSSK